MMFVPLAKDLLYGFKIQGLKFKVRNELKR